ncbi:hypothetical protein CEXT_807201 [Caerostris extrusa]|uniref:Uncharacterized protein n=1 Tax=Caerostris extrusa TaxID=172846 RepID=A0AAV4RXP7_CAEEX|nr:hypothetical protein CEXT_807201 [Caerostris extrusa]
MSASSRFHTRQLFRASMQGAQPRKSSRYMPGGYEAADIGSIRFWLASELMPDGAPKVVTLLTSASFPWLVMLPYRFKILLMSNWPAGVVRVFNMKISNTCSENKAYEIHKNMVPWHLDI